MKMYENVERVIRSHLSKNRQCNDPKNEKRTNNDLQNTTQMTKIEKLKKNTKSWTGRFSHF